MPSTALVWFRRDLRVHDHPPLRAALDACERVVPVFVLDDRLLARPPRLRQPHAVHARVPRGPARGAPAARREPRDRPRHARARAAEAGRATTARPRSTSPPTRARSRWRRDQRVEEALKEHGDRAAPHARQLRRRHRQAQALRGLHARSGARGRSCRGARSTARRAGRRSRATSRSARSRACSSPTPSRTRCRAARPHARKRMNAWLRDGIDTYAEHHDRVAGGTSMLSPYLHFGCVSARELEEKAGRHDAYTRQLAWRDFYAHVLLHNPDNATHAYRKELDAIDWDGRDEHFDAWREGRTGYPIVDAGMRELAATGWMHNRARLITACFLVKDLHIDWRRGERHFMRAAARRRRGQQQRQLAVDLLGRRRSRAGQPPPLQPDAPAAAPRPQGRVRPPLGPGARGRAAREARHAVGGRATRTRSSTTPSSAAARSTRTPPRAPKLAPRSARFTIEPKGPFTLASAARFVAGWPPGKAQVGDDEVRLHFLVDDWSGPARVVLRQDGDAVHRHRRGRQRGARDRAGRADRLARPRRHRLRRDRRPDRAGAAAARAATCARCSSTRPTRPRPGRSISARTGHAQAVKLRDALGETFPHARASCSSSRSSKVCPRTRSRACTASPRRRWRASSTASRCWRWTRTRPTRDLQELPGIGPFYAGLILIRAVGTTDVAPKGEPRLEQAVQARYGRPLDEVSDGWRPFRTWISVLMRANA